MTTMNFADLDGAARELALIGAATRLAVEVGDEAVLAMADRIEDQYPEAAAALRWLVAPVAHQATG